MSALSFAVSGDCRGRVQRGDAIISREACHAGPLDCSAIRLTHAGVIKQLGEVQLIRPGFRGRARMLPRA
jgi:hypothetical protein